MTLQIKMAGRPPIDWIPYQDVKPWVHRLRLGNYKLWLKYVKENKLPDGVPRNPQLTYPDYVSDADFLGHNEYWPYLDAKRYVQTQNIPSYTQWLKWHDENKPLFIPKYPDQIAGYRGEWESWGEFLGTGTVAHYERVYRPWEELVKYAHGLKIKTAEEWIKINHPSDVHRKPYDYFKGSWQGWDHFLGRNIAERMAVQKIQTGVLFLIHENGYPSNVIRIGVEPNGKSALLAKQQERGFHVIKLFKYEIELKDEIDSAIKSNTQEWWESDQHFLVGNIHSLLYDLQRILLLA